ncbi:hypothetical protein [Emticicia oligotrophica]|uniref:hypothetical protein n=1 Tax=Emticicia oligotrophica TaxID=312279 RepID=UPI0002D60B0A|nr:hypothetical protein [Emticicia oligotrophica]
MIIIQKNIASKIRLNDENCSFTLTGLYRHFCKPHRISVFFFQLMAFMANFGFY